MTPTQWKRPRTGDRPLRVQFRCGHVSNFPLPAKCWRWTNTGDAWDIVAVERA